MDKMKDSAPKILLCVSGGIAAYKAIDLASMLQKQGYQIRTILTDGAREFVSPINFSAITHGSVHTSLFEDSDPIPHINLADWADLLIVAPATANIIAKAAHGLSDDLLSATLLAHTKPVLWIPAMNVNMYANPATQDNLGILKKRGHFVLEPMTGMLACGYEGKGKYPPNEEVLYAIRQYLCYGKDLIGKRILLTAGASIEAIDPMRSITNRSSGKMGLALARAFALRGADVTLVYASVMGTIPYYLKEAIYAPSVMEMYEAVMQRKNDADWIVKCAAVSDYKPRETATNKIKKDDSPEAKDLTIVLSPTIDILKALGQDKGRDQLLIGFAAETENLDENATLKLQKKNLDMIVVNHLQNAGSDDNSIRMHWKNGHSETHSGDKFALANLIIDQIKVL